jgi:hypothetical protein
MHTVVFIHGTGVREAAYQTSFNLVQQALNDRFGVTGARVEPCYWGGPHGSQLFLGGISIPDFDTTRAAGEDAAEIPDPTEYPIALWALLYDDPYAELELLALSVGGEAPPGQEPAGAELDQRVRTLTPNTGALPPAARQELGALLAAVELTPHFVAARDDVVGRAAYRAAMAGTVEPLTDFRLAVARAILARAVQRYLEAADLPDGAHPLDGATRDRIVELLVAALGGREAGVADWVKEKAGRLVARVGTRWFKGRRGRLSAQMAPFGADIIVYQTRPAAIRGFIRDVVSRASAAAKARGESGEITLLAHSLGGIAAVDALIEQPHAAVRHLITVGSQSPLLYELDALAGLALQRDAARAPLPAPHALPDHFPESWLNVYDRRDFLSYRAGGVFGAHVTDVEVDNSQPFPEAHSAYWTNAAVWDAIAGRLKGTV